VARSTNPSCAGLTRASIFFAKSFHEEGWIAGSSPAMTGWMDAHAISVTMLAPLWWPSARLQMQPAGMRKYNRCFPIVLYNEFCNSHGSAPLTAMWLAAPMRQAAACARLGDSVVPAKAGTHDQRPVVMGPGSPPACAGVGRDDGGEVRRQ
jgi:hypothetical protein